MTEAQAAVGMDRLPWLTDDPKPRAPEPRLPSPPPRRGASGLAGWVVAAMLLIAGVSYWLGTRTGGGDQPMRPTITKRAEPTATVRLPEVRQTVQPQEVVIAPAPEVRPAPAPSVEVPDRPAQKPAAKKRVTAATPEEDKPARPATQSAPPAAVARPVTTAQRPAVTRPQPLTLWPSRVSRGAYGRLVQIGAFGSRQQAKLGWRRMTRAYPAMGRLPAVVVETRNSRGRRFYRFQIGTTSQAHSEVLCQRMRRIRFSCAVVGLPWKAKVER